MALFYLAKPSKMGDLIGTAEWRYLFKGVFPVGKNQNGRGCSPLPNLVTHFRRVEVMAWSLVGSEAVYLAINTLFPGFSGSSSHSGTTRQLANSWPKASRTSRSVAERRPSQALRTFAR